MGSIDWFVDPIVSFISSWWLPVFGEPSGPTVSPEFAQAVSGEDANVFTLFPYVLLSMGMIVKLLFELLWPFLLISALVSMFLLIEQHRNRRRPADPESPT